MMNTVYDNSFNRYKVLIYGAGGRQSLPVCKGFFTLGCTVVAYCGSKLDTGYLTRYVTERVLYDQNNAENLSFYEYGERFIKEGQYDLVVPLGDDGAYYLSKNKERLSQYARIVVNDWDVFQYAIDKSKTMKVCMERGISAPKTINTACTIDEMQLNELAFPVAVKPAIGKGSIGFNIIYDKQTLVEYIEKNHTDKNRIVIQEFIKQGKEPQYRADLFRDRDGNYKAAIVGKVTRWYPLDGGSGIYAETIHNDSILLNCKKLLDAIDWNGYANIDLVWDIESNEAKILEINGRTGATIMEDYHAGINISQLMLENELELPVTDMTEYEDGSKISCFLPDLLWLLKSPDRFSTNPSWFNRRKVKDSIFSFNDPLPFFGFLLTSILSFRSSMKSRERVKEGKRS